MTTPKTHPLADLFPPMGAEEYAHFSESIARDGLLNPITLYEGKILDGQHRQRVCDERGIQPRYEEWDPSCGITPLEWVIAVNLHRRQLTVAQRAALAVEVKEKLGEAARERMAEGGRKGGPNGPTFQKGQTKPKESRKVAAEQFDIGARTVSRAAQIHERDPAVFARLKAGEISIPAAQKLLGIHDPGGHVPRPTRSASQRQKAKFQNVFGPLRRYLKDWEESWFDHISPAEARRLLAQVQEVDQTLLEIERVLEARTVVSRALR